MIVLSDGTEVGIFIQAVPWIPQRAVHAAKMAKAIGATVVWDERHCAFDTYKKVLRAMGDNPSIVMEDDVRLCDGGLDIARRVIEEHGERMIAFYSSGAKDRLYGSRLVQGSYFGGNLCTYLPRGWAANLLEWYGDRDTEFLRNYHDLAMADWMKRNRLDYWQHVPSLVQHEPWVSAVNPNRGIRQSDTFEESPT